MEYPPEQKKEFLLRIKKEAQNMTTLYPKGYYGFSSKVRIHASSDNALRMISTRAADLRQSHYAVLRNQYLRPVHRKCIHQQVPEAEGLPELVLRSEATVAVRHVFQVKLQLPQGCRLYLAVVRNVSHGGTRSTSLWYGMYCGGTASTMPWYNVYHTVV